MSAERYRLPEEYVVEALLLWVLPEPVRLEPIAPQIGSDCWHLRCGDGTRWVAKFAYDSQEAFERGLQIGQLLDSAGVLRAPVPLRSRSGRLVEIIEGPPGKWHPLAAMSFVPGEPVHLGDPRGAELIGSALGRLHHELSRSQHWLPGISDHLVPYLEKGTADLLEADRVRDAIAAVQLAAAAIRAVPEITRCSNPDCIECPDAIVGGPIE